MFGYKKREETNWVSAPTPIRVNENKNLNSKSNNKIFKEKTENVEPVVIDKADSNKQSEVIVNELEKKIAGLFYLMQGLEEKSSELSKQLPEFEIINKDVEDISAKTSEFDSDIKCCIGVCNSFKSVLDNISQNIISIINENKNDFDVCKEISTSLESILTETDNELEKNKLKLDEITAQIARIE